jgi:hypothetical protein
MTGYAAGFVKWGFFRVAEADEKSENQKNAQNDGAG